MNTAEESKNYLMNTYARHDLTLVKGEGSYVWDENGNKYLDFTSGISVNNLGHCHPAIIKAITDQSRELLHCSNLFWSRPQYELAKNLVEASGLSKVFFSNSGAEANEGAIKLARKYWRHKGQEDKWEIITMEKSFHGRTIATLTATGQDKVKTGFAPLLEGFSYVPFNDFPKLSAAVTEKTAAIMLEPVQGEGGVYPAEVEYIKNIAKLCKEKGILLIFDEIQCGLGRCGKMFCYDNYGVKPDIVTLAKALGGGLPMGAFLAGGEVAQAFGPGSHGSTFGGNPVAAAAGAAYLNSLATENTLANVLEMGEYLGAELAAINSPRVKAVRGMGLLVGLEVQGDSGQVVAKALEKGVILLGAGPNVVRFLPPLNCTKDQVKAAVSAVEAALSEID